MSLFEPDHSQYLWQQLDLNPTVEMAERENDYRGPASEVSSYIKKHDTDFTIESSIMTQTTEMNHR